MDFASRTAPVSWLLKILAVLVTFLALAGLQRYPYAQLELGLGLAVYALLGLWRPHLLLLLMPPWLALVNLAPWSGSLFLEDYDLFLAVTLAVLLARGLYATRIRLTLGEWVFLGLLTLSYGIGMVRGLLPLPDWNPVELSSYYSQWNALRLSKSYFWALVLFPGLVALLRLDQRRTRDSLVWGLALAGGALGVVAMWERGVFEAMAAARDRYAILRALLDFTTPYRITGLFSEMHTGGEAIDGFVALVWPFALLAAATSRSRPIMALGGFCLAGILYAGVTTFSRATYLALLAGALSGGLLWFVSRREGRRPISTLAVRAIPGLLAPVLLAYVFTRGGIQAMAIGLLGWSACLFSGHLASRGRFPAWVGMAILMSCAAAWGMAESMMSSRWVTNTSLAAGLLSVFAALIVGVGGFSSGRRLGPLVGTHGVLVAALVIVFSVGIVSPALLGSRMEVRTATNEQDLETRVAHWRDAISIMNPDAVTTLFGMGIGRFPATYLWAHSTENQGSYRFLADTNGYHLALGGGQDLRFTQRIALPAFETYTLSMDVRTADPKAWLRVLVYRRNILLPNEWPGQHLKFESKVENTDGQWHRLTWTFNSGTLGDGARFGRQFLVLELMNWRKYDYVNRAGTVLEIDNVSLKDAQGRELLANGDFSRGLERWFPYFDFNHLPWHIKNVWVKVFFDQGWFGLIGFAGFLAATIFAAVKRGLQGDPWGLAVSASMASFLAVGLFGGLLDMPRIIFMCYLMLFVTALSGPIRRKRLRSPAQGKGSAEPFPAAQEPAEG